MDGNVIELKILYSNLDKTISDGVIQVGEYAAQSQAEEVHLIIFNRDVNMSWQDKIWHQNQYQYDGLSVEVWGA